MALELDTSKPLKAQWAKQHAIISTLKEISRHRIVSGPLPKHELPKETPNLIEHVPKKSEWQSFGHKTYNIGVVGAGAAGLFTAQVLEHLNTRLHKKGVPLTFKYEILEASGPERVGGRLFTHNFEDKPDTHNYYDVGAMRFPDNPVMKRTFDLFACLGMKKVDFKEHPDARDGCLIPYYMNNGGLKDPQKQPWCFNDITAWGGTYGKVQQQSPDYDTFQINTSRTIPDDLWAAGPDAVMKDNIEEVRKALKKPGMEGWDLLMTYDKYSTRQFLGTAPDGLTKEGDADAKKPIQPPPYNYDTIEWMETFNGGTDWYDQAHSETVLENLDFDYSESTPWYCVLGGAQQLAKRMQEHISNKPTYNTRVTSIKVNKQMDVDVEYVTKSGEIGKKTNYDAVFTTTTLGCLGHMDLRKAGLSYSVKQAIRSLGYGTSAKAAIKFKRAWWIHDLGSYNIKSGGLGHSDLSLRTCVYPSYNIYDSKDDTAVLLCSYTWQQDSDRIGALMSNNPDPAQKVKDEARLKNLLLRDLAQLHETPEMPYEKLLAHITELYDTHHAWNWSEDPNTCGAFAFFRPQQFSSMWPELIQPSGDVVILGEAASPHHAWVVGALESVIHGLYSWLGLNMFNNELFVEARKILASTDKEDECNPFVGLPPYMEPEVSDWQSALGIVHRSKHLGKIGAEHVDSKALYGLMGFESLKVSA